ncbi:MAG: TlpA family protein disulfide reductase [Alphaproteobacteria bacterium]|nr:TlpA family protein disulfide reductase [Alphaproteobacteria bacterium]
MDGTTRRLFIGGLAALMAGEARADEASPLAHGALANNPLAQAFEPFSKDLPDVVLNGPKGDVHITDFKGKTLVMPLWAEWCTPCMTELADFGRLQAKYGNDSFAIMPVLTGTMKQMTPATLAQIFGFLHADSLQPLVEAHFGDRLFHAMARKGDEYELPCNLVIAPGGTVIAREIGLRARPHADDDPAKNLKGEAYRAAILGRAEAGEVLTLWGTVVGEMFAAALANGFLAGK